MLLSFPFRANSNLKNCAISYLSGITQLLNSPEGGGVKPDKYPVKKMKQTGALLP